MDSAAVVTQDINEILAWGRLKELIHYDPETGLFMWRVDRRHAVKAGDVAGGLEKQGYRQTSVNGRCYRAGRLAWFYVNSKWPTGQIDHINGVRDDDRYCNLRVVLPVDNCRNTRMHPCNRSGTIGVCWHKASKKWHATIGINNTKEYLGSYDNYFDAVIARKKAEAKYGFHKNHGRA